jgi:hypothetical protein
MVKKVSIWGRIVSYDDSVVRPGINYLTNQLEADQAKVFFDQAFSKGSAVFEDHMGLKFELLHKGSEYQLIKHQ